MRITTRAATALATGALLATALVGCGDDDPDASDDPTEAGGSPSTGAPPSNTPPDSTIPTTSTSPGSTLPTSTGSQKPGTAAVPAYFVGDTPQGPRLYREFQRVPAADKLLTAARLVAAGAADDPDYRSVFPTTGGIDAVSMTPGTIRVEVSDPSWLRRGDLSARDARLAVQALVYTLQGAAQQRLPVTVRAPGDGASAATLFGVPVKDGLRAAQPLNVLAFVNVTTPAQGSTVSQSLLATGVASSFEGTVPWEIRRGDADGKVVKRGFAQAAGYVDKLYPWQRRIDLGKLAPGAYTFVALTDDPSGGEGGGPTVDTKAFTID